MIHRVLFRSFIAVLFAAPLIGEEPASQLLRVSKLSQKELSAVQERAVQGDADAQLALGIAYDGGNRAFKRDHVKARHWYEISAKQGNLDARYWLIGMDSPQAKNLSVIRSRYLALARAGHIGGMNAYAGLCAEGAGGPQDLSGAMLWWRKAADAGSSEGAFNVGIMHLEGEGVPANEKDGVDWLRRAASQGSIPAASQLGAMAILGKAQLKPGPESTRWLRSAAEAGDANSMLNLGMALFYGKGIETDYVEAYMWFTLAAEQGLIDGRIGLRPKMTPTQVVEAEKRVAIWDANHRR